MAQFKWPTGGNEFARFRFPLSSSRRAEIFLFKTIWLSFLLQLILNSG
jgi:hypothetical protein